MSKNRYINTRFWSDNFISELNPLDRYLFLYFLTNEHTNICGIYELPLRTISFETGIEIDMLKKMIKRLEGKIYYVEGWVYIKNFARHQAVNEKVTIGIENAKKLVPKKIWLKIKEIDSLDIGDYSLSISCQLPEPESEPELESYIAEASSANTTFSFKEEIKKLEDNPRRELNIVAMYFEQRNPDIQNKEQLKVAISRHIRAAKQLIHFSDTQILDALPKAKKSTPDFTLETLIKMLTK